MQRAIIQTVTILVVTAGTLGGLQRAGRTQERPAAPPPRIAAVTPAEPGRSGFGWLSSGDQPVRKTRSKVARMRPPDSGNEAE